MKNNKFKGLGVAMITPFNEDHSIDFAALTELTEFLIQGGVNYLVVQGTTGESPVLTKQEKTAVLKCVAEANKKRVAIVYGVGGNNTAAIAESFKELDKNIVDGILSVSPYYNKPTQEGIYQHYKVLANSTDLPIILYNVPGRTASNVLPDTTLRLANEFKNIVAIKEASGNMEQIMDLIQRKPADFLIISGDDGITLPIIAAGGDGVISVVGNAFPHSFSAMVRAAMSNDMEKARELHYLLFPIIPMLFAEGNPAGIKECTASLGITRNTVRLPLVNVSEGLKTKIIAQTSNICKAFPYDLIKK
ncbi:MAG: 4-hydroxy-tetrahydrodipicolinate synthase [Crocinitomicaceae bacterium]|jgi:4-hydroxy-tetrahydrodipicolinate synthase|nr:4-hydroxy-tetrahydrodipicolinate synthase [Crocinitomicaceae bacterium]MBK9591357.1 4-hydroxy-tetrahydrodipicolinate synthase [Crocinitomicaceae bacterium]